MGHLEDREPILRPVGGADGGVAAVVEGRRLLPRGGEGGSQRHGGDFSIADGRELGQTGALNAPPPSDLESFPAVVDDAAVGVPPGILAGRDWARPGPVVVGLGG